MRSRPACVSPPKSIRNQQWPQKSNIRNNLRCSSLWSFKMPSRDCLEFCQSTRSPDSKWHEATVYGCKGASVHGRNLGTCASCSDVSPRQEDPHGSARCREKYRGRRASASGADHVCQGTCREARGARSREGHLQAAVAPWV